jgi:hypothetical protein
MNLIEEYQASGRLNLSGFINLNKSAISQEEFVEKYIKSGGYEIFSGKSISDFKKSISNDLVKGEIGADELRKCQNELSTLKRVEVLNGDVIVMYVREISKGAVDSDNNIEKGMIVESFGSYSNNKLSFNKTGKQIKDQIDTILLPLLDAQLLQLNTELISISKDITIQPDDFISEYEYRGFAKVLPKVARYSYKQTENEYDRSMNRCEPQTEEQLACSKYNHISSQIVSTMSDIQYSKLLSKNLEDNKKYELTTDQILALQF